MDGLRSQAWEEFLQQQKFEEPSADLISPQVLASLSYVTVRQFEFETLVEQARISRQDTLKRMRESVERHKNQAAIASLKVVRIDRQSDGVLSIDQNAFVELFEILSIDTYCLHMLQRSVYGSFQFKRLINQGPDYVQSSYINIRPYNIIWSYTSTNSTTRAIILPRFDGLTESDNVYGRFVLALERHKALIDNPKFLSFLCGVELVQWIDDFINREFPIIRKIEEETGFGVWLKETRQEQSRDTQHLTEMSTRAGICLIALANVSRHISISRKIFLDLSSQVTSASPQSSLFKITEAVDVLQGQVDSSEVYNAYVQERARTQQTVIFNLLGREDALLSTEIAIAAKNDSSAMKTIAIMTMAFLPATFFAALFAIPSLQWQNDKVISHRFWVYWAFTIPSTALVFMIWWVPIGLKSMLYKKRNQTVQKGHASMPKSGMMVESSGSDEKEGNTLGLPWHRPRLRWRQKGLPIHEREMMGMGNLS